LADPHPETYPDADDADDASDTGSDAEADDEPAAEAGTRPTPAQVDPRSLPARPYASVIATAIVAVQLPLDGCGEAFGTHGAVRVKLRIAPAGTVESVTVLDGNGKFRSCVADAVRRVRVNASTLGATETLAIRVH
jgi:outer membrane biosynthesis protein TonB